MNPELVILEGNTGILNRAKITRAIDSLSDNDLDRLCGGGFYPDDRNYLETNYPEMMGIAVTAVTSVLSAVGGLVGRIAKRVRARRKARKNQQHTTNRRNEQRKRLEQQRMMIAISNQNKEKKRKQTMIIATVAGIALLSYLL